MKTVTVKMTVTDEDSGVATVEVDYTERLVKMPDVLTLEGALATIIQERLAAKASKK